MTRDNSYGGPALGDQMTVKEVVRDTRLSRSKVYELMDEGVLDYYQLGASRRPSRRSVEAFLRAGLHSRQAADQEGGAEAVPAAEVGGVPAPAESAAPIPAAATVKDVAVLAPALTAARACNYCSWEFVEAVRSYAPDYPGRGDRDQVELLRFGVAANLAELRDAVRDGYRCLPEALPLLERVAVGPSVTVALPRDALGGFIPGALAEPTAHAVAHRLGLYTLMRAWRVADLPGYRAAMRAADAPEEALDNLDPQAVAVLLREKWHSLEGFLPTFDAAALDGALRTEAMRAGLSDLEVRPPARRTGHLSWQVRGTLRFLLDLHAVATPAEFVHLVAAGRLRALKEKVGEEGFAEMVALAREEVAREAGRRVRPGAERLTPAAGTPAPELPDLRNGCGSPFALTPVSWRAGSPTPAT